MLDLLSLFNEALAFYQPLSNFCKYLFIFCIGLCILVAFYL